MPRLRPYTGGLFSLELDGSNVGFVNSIDGGHFKSDPVKWSVGRNFLTHYFPGKPKYEDVTVVMGMSTSEDFWDWIKASLDNDPIRKSGALVAYDLKGRERQRRTFSNALLTEIGFPALDGSSKSAATMTIKFSPETLTWDEPNTGNKLRPGWAKNEIPKQKLWLASNFNFSLDKFQGDASLRHAKIEALTIKQAVLANPMGNQLETNKEPGRPELPMIQVSFPQADMEGWMDWYESAVVQGNYPDELTTGQLQFMASDGATELLTLDFDRVGLVSLELDKLEAHKEGIARCKATLYTTKIELTAGKGVT